jgi:hypothetical protein
MRILLKSLCTTSKLLAAFQNLLNFLKTQVSRSEGFILFLRSKEVALLIFAQNLVTFECFSNTLDLNP